MGRCRNMALATRRNLPAFDKQIDSRRLQDGGKRHEQPWRCVAGRPGSIGRPLLSSRPLLQLSVFSVICPVPGAPHG
jgi:hypothetical protein